MSVQSSAKMCRFFKCHRVAEAAVQGGENVSQEYSGEPGYNCKELIGFSYSEATSIPRPMIIFHCHLEK